MIKNLRLYRVHSAFPEDELALSAALEQRAFKPCLAFSESSLGFVSSAEGLDMLARTLMGSHQLRIRIQSRVLPPAAIKEALNARISEFTQRTTRDPSRREKRDLKDEVYADLLPKALLQSEHITLFYMVPEQILVVGTASEKKAELCLDALRDALGSLQVTPLASKSPVSYMFQSLMYGSGDPTVAKEFYAGRDCVLGAVGEPRSKITVVDCDLSDSSVRQHLRDGYSPTRMAIKTDVSSLTLDEDLVVSKLSLNGIDDVDDLGDENPLVRQDAEFVLLNDVTRDLLRRLERVLGVAA